jgi:hypothetical protein
MDKALEAFFDTNHFPSEADACFNRSTNYGVQGGTISAACQYSDAHGFRY